MPPQRSAARLPLRRTRDARQRGVEIIEAALVCGIRAAGKQAGATDEACTFCYDHETKLPNIQFPV